MQRNLTALRGRPPGISRSPSKQDAIQEWFDPAAFVLPASGQFGNSARNNLRAPGFWNLSIGLYRNLPLGERFRAQFRSEFFNVFNHANLGPPGASMDSMTFGTIRATVGGPRIIQFALKLCY